MKTHFLILAFVLFFWSNQSAAQSKYFVVCCKSQCSWSDKTTKWDEAQEMAKKHENSLFGHDASFVRINPKKIENKYKVICDKCRWESPTTTLYLDGDNIETCHEATNPGHFARIIDSDEYIDIDEYE